MKMFTFDTSSFTSELNVIKEVILGALLNEGMITKKDFHIFTTQYAVVLQEKNMFGKLWDKIRGGPTETEACYTIVRGIPYSLEDDEDDDDSDSPIKLVPNIKIRSET